MAMMPPPSEAKPIMVTLYGIKNCDTVKRARKALDEAGITYRFHDFRADGLRPDKAQAWIDALGLDAVLNRRGTTWRQLDPAEQARAEGSAAATLLAEQPTLIKRPVFEHGDDVLIGFPRSEAPTILARLHG